jgi:hypothetical protein
MRFSDVAGASSGEETAAARTDVAGECRVDDKGLVAPRRGDAQRLSGLTGGKPRIDSRQPNPEFQCLDADDDPSEAGAVALEARADADLIVQAEVDLAFRLLPLAPPWAPAGMDFQATGWRPTPAS